MRRRAVVIPAGCIYMIYLGFSSEIPLGERRERVLSFFDSCAMGHGCCVGCDNDD